MFGIRVRRAGGGELRAARGQGRPELGLGIGLGIGLGLGLGLGLVVGRLCSQGAG